MLCKDFLLRKNQRIRLFHPEVLMKNLIIPLCLFLQIFCFNAFSSELDSFTLRKEIQSKMDSLVLLNNIVRDKLKEGESSLSAQYGCDKDHLISVIKKKLIGGFAIPFPQCRVDRSYPWVSGFKGNFESLIQKGKGHSKNYVVPMKKKDSIFRNVTVQESTAITIVLGSLLNMKGLVVGSDKFGHFFSQGHEYYSLGGTKQISKVLEYGHCLETKVLGLSTSGVYSYGDLAANIMGMLFWERVPGEYFICKENTWTLNPNKAFSWHDYVSPAWDEGINNSFYYSKLITQKVKDQVIKLQDSKNVFLTPPISQHYCEQMVDFFTLEKNFGKKKGLLIAKHAISPICLNIYAKSLKEKEMGIVAPKIPLKKWRSPEFLLNGEAEIDRRRLDILYRGIGDYINFSDSHLNSFWRDIGLSY